MERLDKLPVLGPDFLLPVGLCLPALRPPATRPREEREAGEVATAVAPGNRGPLWIKSKGPRLTGAKPPNAGVNVILLEVRANWSGTLEGPRPVFEEKSSATGQTPCWPGLLPLEWLESLRLPAPGFAPVRFRLLLESLDVFELFF